MELNKFLDGELALSLKNKNILLTGVSRSMGIGAAITKRLTKAGANVAIHGYADYEIPVILRERNMRLSPGCFPPENGVLRMMQPDWFIFCKAIMQTGLPGRPSAARAVS